jgi:MFS family permease
MLIDFSPFIKYRDFRWLFLGQFISFFGNMLTYVALPYQVYHLTHSSLAVGNIGIVQLVPLLITSLWGGALADRLDRKKLLLVAEFGLLLTSILLLCNSLLSTPQLWLIYVIAAISSALSGFQRPTLEAITQHLIKVEDMGTVAALQTCMFSISMIAGPAIAGILLAKFNLAIVYAMDACTYLIALVAVFSIKTSLKLAEQVSESILQTIKAGIRYAMSRQELIGTYVIDFVAMVFGMPMALFPALAHTTFHSVTALGWLYAAPSIGALVSIFTGWADKIKRHGAAVAACASIWGSAIIVFGFIHSIYFAVLFLAIAGATDALSGIFRMAMWNQTIPQELRGRLASIAMISYMSGPLLGNAEAGFVAHLFDIKFSVISGGVLCIIGVVILTLLLPKFWRYKSV